MESISWKVTGTTVAVIKNPIAITEHVCASFPAYTKGMGTYGSERSMATYLEKSSQSVQVRFKVLSLGPYHDSNLEFIGEKAVFN